uniref:Na_H_Exchanger domain-containing protein n=1 Tax=Macrostomum lignano TaxID=282301 RepID=A0A1I8HXR4_9PLAT
MLKLEYRGYGVEKGIPTLIIAASSMDDVLAITGFSLALGIVSSDGSGGGGVASAILRGPRDAVVGILYGLGLGALLWYIPHRGHKRPVMFRFIFLVGGGVIALLGCEKAHLQGAGALGVLTLAFVAGYGWRRWDGWAEEDNPMLEPLDTMWWFMQPMLFGLIGGQIDFQKIQPPALAKGLAVVGIGLVFRMLASFLCMLGTELSFRERLFVPFSWLPKATVQAAIGPVALDMALSQEPRDDRAVDMGRQVLTIAAIVIMLTAPVGAFLISLLGPRLLERDKNWELHHFDLASQGNCHGASSLHQHSSQPRPRSQAVDLEAMRRDAVELGDDNEAAEEDDVAAAAAAVAAE